MDFTFPKPQEKPIQGQVVAVSRKANRRRHSSRFLEVKVNDRVLFLDGRTEIKLDGEEQLLSVRMRSRNHRPIDYQNYER